MKISISYTSEESRLADAALKLLRGLFPGARMHSSITHPPRKIVYLTTTNGRKHCKH